MGPFTDDILIRGIINREDQTFKYLQVTYEEVIRIMVIEKGGTPEDAKDVFNEGIVALIKLVEKPGFKLTCKLGTLIYALCRNKWLSMLEKKRSARNYHLRRSEEEQKEDFSEEMDMELYRKVFWENFKLLDKICQDILGGYLQDLSPAEIAKKLGYSYGYVRKRKSLCHKYLMERIKEHPDYLKIVESEYAGSGQKLSTQV